MSKEPDFTVKISGLTLNRLQMEHSDLQKKVEDLQQRLDAQVGKRKREQEQVFIHIRNENRELRVALESEEEKQIDYVRHVTEMDKTLHDKDAEIEQLSSDLKNLNDLREVQGTRFLVITDENDDLKKALGRIIGCNHHRLADGPPPLYVEIARQAMKGAKSENHPLTFERIWEAHEAWSVATFGLPEVKGPLGPIRHLRKEAKELEEDPTDRFEYADCAFLVNDAARRQGLSLQDFLQAMSDKLAILKTRSYVPDPNNPDDPVEHDRSMEDGE